MRDRRELLSRLIVAEVIARRGEGPLAPRFGRASSRTLRPDISETPVMPEAENEESRE